MRLTHQLPHLILSAALALAVFFLFGSSASAAAVAPDQGKIAIVIDDLGNDMGGTKELFELDIPLTVAVMPFLSTGQRDAHQAYYSGKEVILHVPMEFKKGKRSWLGPGAIFTAMSSEKIQDVLEKQIEDIPHIVGMNNHMGSRATGSKRVMDAVMEVAALHNLFFLDSSTTFPSAVAASARHYGVPALRNELFLDDIGSVHHVKKQMKKAAAIAKDKGAVIVIGHVGVHGKKTMEGIRQSLPMLAEEGIRPVLLSELVRDAAAGSR